MRSYFLCWLLLVISRHAWCQEPPPIMELYDFVDDPDNIIKNSGCKDVLMTNVDYFTVRGKVNKNGSNPNAYKDTTLYLQAVGDPSTNAWASQCRPNLTVCGSYLNTDCYCERKDANGDYHLVMTIMAKSIYSGGALMLSWNDGRYPYNPPVLSNQVNYYPGTINNGPISAYLTFQPPGTIYLCPNQQTNINITCQVCENSNMHDPSNLFTIRDGGNNNLIDKATGDTAWKKTVSYNFTKPGQHTFTCRAENAIHSDVFSEASAGAVQVYEPPSDPPKLSAQSCQHDNILVEGDRVTVTCDVSGGYPSVQSLILSCGQDHTVMSIGTSVKLTLKEIGLSYNQTKCTCQAAHVTGCDDLMSVLTLTIIPSKHGTFVCTVGELAGAVSGGIIGTLVFVAVNALIAFWIRRKKRQAKNRNTDKAYDTIERQPSSHYQNVRPEDPNYRAINLPVQVPETETTKQETNQETHKNQAFDDYLEPTVPDHYVYSEPEEH